MIIHIAKYNVMYLGRCSEEMYAKCSQSRSLLVSTDEIGELGHSAIGCHTPLLATAANLFTLRISCHILP